MTLDITEFDQLYLHSLLLSKVVERILQRKAKIYLSDKPDFSIVNIVDFMQKMRVSSLEKFDVSTYISTVNFYLTEEQMKKNKSVGAIVVYISEDYVVKLLKKLGYPNFDEDDADVLRDACGTFCNIIGAKFKEGLTQLGYPELFMSHFSSYRNEIVNGVDYDSNQKQKYELSFEIDGHKRIIIDLTLGYIPKEF
ncbi:MAG: chemotaxis protein CheX [Candidatus Omnitrophica bacterium]|nr:chemotaxis protein CheX [Candidatus Omnitrophota bacterium]